MEAICGDNRNEEIVNSRALLMAKFKKKSEDKLEKKQDKLSEECIKLPERKLVISLPLHEINEDAFIKKLKKKYKNKPNQIQLF